MANITLLHGDCREQLKTLPDNSVDSIVTDPPYELGFMGKSWDASGIAYNVDMWRECLRVIKPGGHMLAFSGSRTYHRMTVAIEDAGFEIRDQIMWVYGQGFPKNHDISKAIESKILTGRSDSQVTGDGRSCKNGENYNDFSKTNYEKATFEPTTDDEKRWQGWGTALKPAHEPICVARKPLEGTVAANVLKYGTGALNIDASRVPLDGDYKSKPNGRPSLTGLDDNYDSSTANEPDSLGRWPANLIHDGSEEVVKLFPQSKGQQGDVKGSESSHTGDENSVAYGEYGRVPFTKRVELDNSAARFFYCAKASPKDRNAGLDDFEGGKTNDGRKVDADNAYQRGASVRKNTHPTVKPTDLMRYLVKMVTPPDGTVLDPFMGSGSTGRGAMLEGFNFIGIEMTDEYIPIATARIEDAKQEYENKNNTTYNNLFEEE
jgi:site-specific DNA-methyltransferase (adenine-specific)